MESDHIEIDRADTGIRILYSVFFAIINNLLTGAIGVIVIFELGFSLITMRPPATRVRRIANSMISYSYRLQRWLAHTDSELPFPFSDLPEDIHPIEWPYPPEPEPDLDDPELNRAVEPS
jgi:hypothetical protein